MNPTTGEWYRDICRIGQKEKCCKYLMIDEDGLFCAKHEEQCAKWVNKRTDMVAKGDNCDGVDPKHRWSKDEQKSKQQRA
jgi:hypothetical protein